MVLMNGLVDLLGEVIENFIDVVYNFFKYYVC